MKINTISQSRTETEQIERPEIQAKVAEQFRKLDVRLLRLSQRINLPGSGGLVGSLIGAQANNWTEEALRETWEAIRKFTTALTELELATEDHMFQDQGDIGDLN